VCGQGRNTDSNRGQRGRPGHGEIPEIETLPARAFVHLLTALLYLTPTADFTIPATRRTAKASTIALAVILGLAAGAGIVYAGVSLSAIPSNPNVVVTQTQTITTSGTVSTQTVTTSGAATMEVSSLEGQLYSTNNLLSASRTNASGLQSQLGSARQNLTSLEGELAISEKNATTLQGQVTIFNVQISADDNQIKSLQTQVTTDAGQIAGLQNTVNTDSTQITALQNTIASDNTQITNLQNSVSQDAAQINSLQTSLASATTQVESLQNQVAQLQAAYLVGTFQATVSCGLLGGSCTYTINGAYANLGTSDATSATVTFTFYSAAAAEGQTLCSTTVTIGTVQGDTITMLPQTTCASSYSTQSQSYTWQFVL